MITVQAPLVEGAGARGSFLPRPAVVKALSAPVVPVHPPHPGLLFAIVGVVGTAVAVSAWDALRQAEQATHARSMRPAENSWTQARITGLGSQSMQLTLRDGHTQELALDFGYTSVFQQGGVLSTTHLRQGQQVQVLSSRRAGQAIAKAIALTPGPLSQLVN